MLLNISVLFFVTLLSGLSIFLWKKPDMQKFKILLAFSGSYLFSLTVIHILPEAIAESNGNYTIIGIFVLGGFFLQMLLEYLTSGVEHGHIHIHHEKELTHEHKIPLSLFAGLFLHALLEGMLLYHPSHVHETGDSHNLLFGLSLHKVPEAFALMSVLVTGFHRKGMAIILLILLSAASPLGLIATTFLFNLQPIDAELFVYVFAVIAGSFLYISTTIFFEASPQHQFKLHRLLTALLGAMGAVIGEILL